MKHTVRPPQFNDEDNVWPSGIPPESSEENSPGVYTRAEHRSQADLDLLWSGSKLYHKEERSPVFFFIVGFIVAVLLTSGIFWVLNRPLQVKAGDTDYVDKPIDRIEKIDDVLKENQQKAAAKADAIKAAAKTEPAKAEPAKSEAAPVVEASPKPAQAEAKGGWFGLGNLFGGKKAEEPAATSETQAAPEKPAFQTYVVKSGDTLGGIAEKFYKNSGPDYLQKLQRANNMKNPNSLHLGQKLVIPPEN